MEIKFLGTSATWPLPHPKCQCVICTSRDKRDKRLRSAVFLSENKNTSPILLDCGPDINKQLTREELLKIKAIIISHHHSDHASGLRKLTLKPENLIPVYASLGAHQYFQKNYLQATFKKVIIKPNQKFKIGNLEILPIGINHPGIKPTFAIQIIKKPLKMIYMPDYKLIPKQSLRYFKNLDFLIVGGAILKRNIPWHASIDQTIDTFKEQDIKKIYFTHIGHLTLPYKELVKYVRHNGGKQFDVAFDRLKIALNKCNL